MQTSTPKAIWITGASSGIGRACAEVYANKGYRVVLSSRQKETLEKAAEEICSSGKVNKENLIIKPLDLAENSNYNPVVSEVLNEIGSLDIMLHAGGISQRSLAIDTSVDVDRRVMEIDYFGTIALTKALLPHFIDKKSGHFVVITSLMGVFSSPLRSGYCGAKHALHGFFEALRAEVYDQNINISMVLPGFIATDISLNAVVGDGSKQGTMDAKTEAGLTPMQCAVKLAKGVDRKKAEILIGRSEILAVYLKRFFPRLLRRIIRKAAVT
ncbi:MAG: short-chain dehydrogenase [Crocinitomicaceae bacterium]|nr:short-chain dehydrogenase [Crocinitomicaceae bacterium]|tara:strand:+ start:2641 stop:3450 length:810 start_codon:yes stop_codon:yes gene_type:complete